MAERDLWSDVDPKSLVSKTHECSNMAAPMSLVVETTGFKGGDAGHGGAARMKLQQCKPGSAALEVSVTRNGETYVFSGSSCDVESIEIRAFGDAEMENLQSALLEAAAFLASAQKKASRPEISILVPPLKALSAEALQSGLAEKLSELDEQDVTCSVLQMDYGQHGQLATRLVINVSHPFKR